MIGRRTIEMQSRCQYQSEFVHFEQFVNFAIDIQEQIAFKRSSQGLDSIDSFKFVAIGVECGAFENVFKESDLGV